jgi:hypothetical protein
VDFSIFKASHRHGITADAQCTGVQRHGISFIRMVVVGTKGLCRVVLPNNISSILGFLCSFPLLFFLLHLTARKIDIFHFRNIHIVNTEKSSYFMTGRIAGPMHYQLSYRGSLILCEAYAV